jgi:C1A family cysteine protease
VLNQVGVCEEALDPYEPSKFKDAPTDEQLKNALTWKSGAYHRLNGLTDALLCLSSGYVFSIGFAVYPSFESSHTALTGVMPVPDRNKERLLGGHEVYAHGYDLDKKQFRIRNSWGDGWGIDGDFLMPFEVLDDPTMVFDMWITHLGSAWGTKPTLVAKAA